ncbi:hypothetical protein A584_21798 [Pseudomonas syringae pv. theae ICMP 3923]|uniref:Uncharacterized protein n=1 Tax=Pseudomonas syringae pv. theae TaxID=103985 RepID=A0A0Q0E776_PSESX|nr:hypothetical protein [Pseudomonas syringae]EPM67339.1 hypothetical protein A584_21798 [Pseudomonas syringae pv. theae ICMP 3923]KPZ34610.1 hypothetical protein AN901_204478 [Pseudomonas syringae pv. theae]MBL3832456.1 hypothetical protein [Pseudomonas syringae pv. theae]MBL3868040.1 hypothetical protein [Pseudomonas syringae pv. theae]MBL3873922.1 hypothetical protein [Pseudomonas syringae pv. theae]
MKGNDPIAQILERARQRIEQLAIAGDREVMFHIAAEAQGWIGALQAENLLGKEQCEMLYAELKAAVTKWDGGPE